MRRPALLLLLLVAFASLQLLFLWTVFYSVGSRTAVPWTLSPLVGDTTAAKDGAEASNNRKATTGGDAAVAALPLLTCKPCAPCASLSSVRDSDNAAVPVQDGGTPASVGSEHTPPYSLTVIVFTYNRIQGLKTLLQSLVAADYLGRRDIRLQVFLDFPKRSDMTLDGTREYLDSFNWPHGPYYLHRRLSNVGLKKTITEAWYPTGNREVASFFEDDIEVSPVWFVWVDRALRKYFLDDHGRPAPDAKLLGLSLFRPIMDELSGNRVEDRLSQTAGRPFLLQQPCSWGAVYFPQPWRRFRQWYDVNSKAPASLEDPADPRIRPSSNTWDSGSSWKKFLIKLMYEEGWFMVYPNFPNTEVLSTNHLLPGVHPTPPKKLFELPLVPAENRMSNDERRSLNSFPPLSEMKAFSVMFDEVGSVNELHGYR